MSMTMLLLSFIPAHRLISPVRDENVAAFLAMRGGERYPRIEDVCTNSRVDDENEVFLAALTTKTRNDLLPPFFIHSFQRYSKESRLETWKER
jgi:hypothetical protein